MWIFLGNILLCLSQPSVLHSEASVTKCSSLSCLQLHISTRTTPKFPKWVHVLQIYFSTRTLLCWYSPCTINSKLQLSNLSLDDTSHRYPPAKLALAAMTCISKVYTCEMTVGQFTVQLDNPLHSPFYVYTNQNILTSWKMISSLIYCNRILIYNTVSTYASHNTAVSTRHLRIFTVKCKSLNIRRTKWRHENLFSSMCCSWWWLK